MNCQDKEKICAEVSEIIKKILPDTFNIIVQLRKAFDGSQYLKIGASPSTYEISGVKGQYPQVVSLSLNLETLELETQVFGCMGGGSFYRKIRSDLFPNEKNLALGQVKIPFRKPKKEIKAVYKAIERFFERYLALLKEWRDDLRHKEHGDYSFLNND